MATKRQVVLECVQPSEGHNKYYEITIREANQGRYETYARWGRIEHFKTGKPQTQIKASDPNWVGANESVDYLIKDKIKKGYKIITDSKTPKVNYPGKSQEKHVAVQKEFDRTEHVEVIVSDWWAGHDTIEERDI